MNKLRLYIIVASSLVLSSCGSAPINIRLQDVKPCAPYMTQPEVLAFGSQSAMMHGRVYSTLIFECA